MLSEAWDAHLAMLAYSEVNPTVFSGAFFQVSMYAVKDYLLSISS